MARTWTARRRLAPLALCLALGVALVPSAHAAGVNVVVTPFNPPTSQYRAPSLAVDPTNPARMAIAYLESSVTNACYLATSSDAGTTWTQRRFIGDGGIFPTPAGFAGCDVPSAAFASDGTFYYLFHLYHPNTIFISERVFVATSLDAGTTWGAPHQVVTTTPSTNDWNPRMATDSVTGRLYVTWYRHKCLTEDIPTCVNESEVLTAYSDDRGATFSTPVVLTPIAGQFEPEAPVIAVGADGSVNVAWFDVGPTLGSAVSTVYAASSHDGGNHFGAPRSLAQTDSCLISDLCSVNSVAIAAGAAGQVVVAADVSTSNARRILVTSSGDGGGQWSTPAFVGATAGGSDWDQLVPALSVAPNGRFDLAFYSQAALRDVFVASSTDGGISFPTLRQVDDVSSVPQAGGRPVGKMLGLVALADRSDVAWTDGRRGDESNAHLDVFFSETPL